jgi:ParB family transcriptional regulator, chromosome partitioning protein
MQQPTLPLKHIKLGRNPRTYFDPAKMAEMVESVRVQGVLQPIIVRPLEGDEYEVVAGGRRYRAAMEAHGEDYAMPVVVKELDEAEARSTALVENIQRADMAPSEEAIAAAEFVGMCKGDRDETARILGWSRQTLDKRLALMNCSTSVLEALNTRQILLGHAELLAALSKKNQDRVLPVIVAEKRSVPDVKKLIESAACSLSTAVFDKTDCAACPHNSSTQSEMFGESIATGNCTNRACFNEKTEVALEATATALREDVPVVRIVRAGDNHTRIQLAIDGPSGVGLEQAKACHGCQNYGAAVSGLPDSLGKVYRGQCFDTVCNLKKVAARISAEKAANAPAKAADAGQPASKTGDKPSTKAAGKPAETVATVVAESDRVKAFRVALWRKALRKDIGGNHDLARQYLIAIVLAGHARQINETTFRTMWERLTDEKPPVTDVAKAAAAVSQTSGEVQSNLMLAMLFSAIEGLDVSYLTQLCKHHKLDLTNHWKLSADFLELITKSEMMVIADELGLRAALGDNFKKVFGKSKPEVIEALLKVEGFDYEGKVPKVLKF